MRSNHIALVVAAACLVLALEPARAQDASAAQHNGLTPGAYESTLRARNRELMNPNEPLKIVGMEQGSNHIRAQTPALDNAIRPPVQVDEKVNYRRTIAMYENGARFSEPLPEVAPPGSVSASRAALQAEDNEALDDPVAGDATAHVTSWFLGLGACAMLAFVIRKRLGLQF
jgi:hypothetical protein